MTIKRKAELFDELLFHLMERVSCEEDLLLTLQAIGFTEKEITETIEEVTT